MGNITRFIGRWFSKIDITGIISDHCKTLVVYGTEKPGFGDWLVFLVLPLVLSIILFVWDILISHTNISIIITALSIFIGLLFNILIVLFDILRREKNGDEKERSNAFQKKIAAKIKIIKELVSNISFTILLSVVIIISSLITLVTINYIHWFMQIFVLYNLVLFVLTLLMVLKRIKILFSSEF